MARVGGAGSAAVRVGGAEDERQYQGEQPAEGDRDGHDCRRTSRAAVRA